MSKETLYLVDGTSICYRSFFAIKLSTSGGLPTGAVYGFFQTLKKIISKYNPKYLGICFDVSRKTHRQEKFKDYKIQRPPLPDGLGVQLPLIRKLIDYLGIRLVEKEGFEADDVIATLVDKALKNNLSIVIVSSDKDIYQLLEDRRVRIYNPNHQRLLAEEDFIKEYGFKPSLIVDYLSLTGDSVDNIPGAKGIGKVGATRLIKSFGNVENIFNNLDKIAPKTKKLLLENKEDIFLSKELVELSIFNLKLDWQDLKVKEPNYREITNLFQKLEFKALLKSVPAPASCAKIEIKEGLPKDFLPQESLTFFIDGDWVYVLIEDRIYKDYLYKVKDVIEDERVKKISYDFKEQLLSLKDIKIKGIWFDVKIAAYLIDSTLADYSLATLVSHYLGDFCEIPAEAAPYFIDRLFYALYQKLKEDSLDKLFFEVEIPLIYVLADMQKWGVKIDLEVMVNLFKEIEKRLSVLKNEIFKIAGKEFNLNSPKQLRTILFEELKLPPFKKTKTGYSTGEEVLEKLAPQYKIADLLLEYRQLNKLKTTYISPLIEEVKLNDGRLFAKFNQTKTTTGRLSSSSPNLQSIPARGKFSSYLRKAFIPAFPNGFILSCDYSQIELRILAHFSGDVRLLEAFKKSRDIHRYTASLLFGVSEEEVSQKQRDLAKRVNFGIIYGMSPFGLARELKINPQEAESIIADYFLRYPKVRNYIEKAYKEAESEGFIRTIMGRKRNLPDLKSSNPQLRDFARRQAINAPIQGSCADLIKKAMVKIYNEFKERNLSVKMIIQIHDELLFDLPSNEIKEVTEIVKRNMQECVKLAVPIKVNLKIGKNWGEMEVPKP